MIIRQHEDRWYLFVGQVTREEREDMVEWCYQTWGSGWGEVDTKLGQTVFIFSQLNQANWFSLKWA